MIDQTEGVRRVLTAVVNSAEVGRAEMEKEHGQVWNTQELQAEFEVLGFAAPFVTVRRKSDGKQGTMWFQHHPRFYFGFQ